MFVQKYEKGTFCIKANQFTNSMIYHAVQKLRPGLMTVLYY